ncbi:MAG: hypothetical protein AB1758_24950 [Candidatus Eremiobacterota bacterium]
MPTRFILAGLLLLLGMTQLGFVEQDYLRHAEALRERLPGPEFTVRIEPPFVVAGDGGAQAVEAHCRSIVRWAVERLKNDFFEKDPDRILTIWLFRDADSYRRNNLKLFGEEPFTPFGYFSDRHGALVMNIGTGGGTLVHEIVHPFMAANFPRCPAWFNEGMGSLYEQCGDRDGHIVGYTNWRLPVLQEALRKRQAPRLATVVATTDDQFYGENRPLNYATARYLCYYLQERGKLVEFYHAFRKDCALDPTGRATLLRVLEEEELARLEPRWERFVMGLRF